MSPRAIVVLAGTALTVIGVLSPAAHAQRALTNVSPWTLPTPVLSAAWNGNTPTHDASGVTGTTAAGNGCSTTSAVAAL
jgi:hypothetical protein